MVERNRGGRVPYGLNSLCKSVSNSTHFFTPSAPRHREASRPLLSLFLQSSLRGYETSPLTHFTTLPDHPQRAGPYATRVGEVARAK